LKDKSCFEGSLCFIFIFLHDPLTIMIYILGLYQSFSVFYRYISEKHYKIFI
jgi:hypothetical protein